MSSLESKTQNGVSWKWKGIANTVADNLCQRHSTTIGSRAKQARQNSPRFFLNNMPSMKPITSEGNLNEKWNMFSWLHFRT